MSIDESKGRLLVWLPSPLGDAVMCTPALKAIRESMPDKEIFFYGSPIVRQTLSPTDFADGWVELKGGILKKISVLKKYRFDTVVLFKNSFSCALTVFLAGIKKRVGYYRDCRSIFLTDGLKPAKVDGKFVPAPMMDYYLNLLAVIGVSGDSKKLDLNVDPDSQEQLKEKLPAVFKDDSPLVILVPGGAFGPSKCWPVENYAEAADYLVDKYNACVVVSVAPNERRISSKICSISRHRLIDLANSPLNMGQLKALIGKADLVIANDTGPRHIAIALDRKVITMFGPNDPKWTDSKHTKEIQLVTDVDCAPCQKAECPKGDAECMRNITVENVCKAAGELLG
ncbi:MAG: lipopolysaccharide heptosyltransferase II [Sedimentisphaeraceae bacterium JB056]